MPVPGDKERDGMDGQDSAVPFDLVTLHVGPERGLHVRNGSQRY